MSKNQNFNLPEDSINEAGGLDFRILLEKYARYWKWFLLSLIVSLLIAAYKLNFARAEYKATTSIKIKDEKNGDQSALSAFQDLGFMGSTQENIDDQIEILRSKSLVSEVLKTLHFNQTFYTEKNGLSNFLDNTLGFETNFYEDENYKKSPLIVKFFSNDSTLNSTSNSFYIKVNSANSFTFHDAERSITKKSDFGKKLTTNIGDMTILPNVDLKKEGLIGEEIYVVLSSIKDLTNAYVEKLEIEPKSEFSNIISISLNDSDKQKAEDFLNELVNKYNQRAIDLKEALSKSTSDFVSERLDVISKELANVDLTAEGLKTQFRQSDAASDVGINMQADQQVESQIVAANTELQKIGYIKDVLSDNNGNEVIPVNVGVQNGNISALTNQYNELVMQKKRLLENSTEKNPIVANINEQLKSLNNNIKSGLNNLESAQQISLSGLQSQSAKIRGRLYSAPKQERQIRDVQRQQQIKEQLYLYLLQKREETAITLGVADPKAEIIDRAESLTNKVAPKKKVVYALAALLGLLLPAGFIYMSDLLDSKIHTREDVEKVLNIPIIGDIPKLESTKERYLIKKEDNSSIAEAFRILRTNLNFILPKKTNGEGKVVFVTSTIAHEGKSLVSTNLATSLAHAGKSTLLLGMDVRAPKIEPYLGIKGKIGVTNFVANSDISPADIIIKHPNIENLSLISSGDLAPNPSELLMDNRIAELFEYARENYEHIIVDTAAFSMVTDTMVLSKYADAFIYVIRTNFLDKRMLKYVNDVYKSKRLQNLTLLVNGVDHKRSYGYGYGYGYGEKFDQAQKSKKAWWKFNS